MAHFSSRQIREYRIHELGAGNGASMGLLSKLKGVASTGSDIAATAIKQCEATCAPGAASFRILDIAKGPHAIPHTLRGQFDAVLCTFVLSAIPTVRHASALGAMLAMLAPGGILCFRDYGIMDHAMLRGNAKGLGGGPIATKEASGASEPRDELGGRCGGMWEGQLVRSFARPDGTLTHFFSLEEFVALCRQAKRCICGDWDPREDTRMQLQEVSEAALDGHPQASRVTPGLKIVLPGDKYCSAKVSVAPPAPGAGLVGTGLGDQSGRHCSYCCRYSCVESRNRKSGIRMQRVFIRAVLTTRGFAP